MKIIKYTKKNKNTYEITLENKEIITIYDELILKYDLLITKELDDYTKKLILEENTYYEAYYKALKYLSIKMRTKFEISKYLSDYPSNIIDKVITKLYEENYLNDEKYITSYINDQINLNNKGHNKILKELELMGFDSNTISHYLNLVDHITWLNNINKYITKKNKHDYKGSSKNYKLKILNDLLNKGYFKEDITQCLDNLEVKDDKSNIIKDYDKAYFNLSKKYQGRELDYKIKNKLLSKGYDYQTIENLSHEKKA